METLSLAVTALALLVAFFRPHLALTGLLVVAPTFDARIPLGIMVAHPSGILVLGCAATGLVTRLRTGFRPSLTRTDLAGLASVAWLLVTLGLANFEPAGIRRVSALLIMAAGYLAGRTLVNNAAALQRLRDSVALSAFLAAVIALFVALPGVAGRGVGNFGNPNALGLYLACGLPFTLSAAVRPSRPALGPPAWLAVVLAAWCLTASGSRGALVGVLAGVAYMMTRQVRRALMLAAATGVLLLLVSLFETGRSDLARIPAALEVAPEVLESSKIWLATNGFIEASYVAPPFIDPAVLASFPKTMGARMMIWYQALVVAWSHPLLGIGPGESNFSGVPFDSKTFANCFNIYLATLVEGGLPSLLLHLVWMGCVVASLYRLYRRSRIPPELVDALGGALLAASIHGIIEDTYFAIYVNWMIGLLAGAVAGLDAWVGGSSRPAPPAWYGAVTLEPVP